MKLVLNSVRTALILVLLLSGTGDFAVSWAGILRHGSGQKGVRCLDKVCFDMSRPLGDKTLFLRGMALRKYIWFDIYTAALYLPLDVPGNPKQVPAGPKILVLEYHRAVEKGKIVETIIQNVKREKDVDEKAVRARFDDLTAAFDPPFPGDRYEFIYEPGRGTSLVKDGQERVVIPGDDFAHAFFGIWISSYTEDHAMRRKLLGLQ